MWAWALTWGVIQFSWVSCMYTGGIFVTKLLFVFVLFICLLSQWGLSQEPTRVERTLFFLLYDGKRLSLRKSFEANSSKL